MAEFRVLVDEDASIAGCLIANLDPHGVCMAFRKYWRSCGLPSLPSTTS
jgi:hypothetical protein